MRMSGWIKILIRIRIRLDPHWFGFLDWDKKLDPYPHWRQCGSTNTGLSLGLWRRECWSIALFVFSNMRTCGISVIFVNCFKAGGVPRQGFHGLRSQGARRSEVNFYFHHLKGQCCGFGSDLFGIILPEQDTYRLQLNVNVNFGTFWYLATGIYANPDRNPVQSMQFRPFFLS